MVEMVETAAILISWPRVIISMRSAGDATFDGSPYRACAEHLHEVNAALFATHYHELTRFGCLARQVLRHAVKEWQGEVVSCTRSLPVPPTAPRHPRSARRFLRRPWPGAEKAAEAGAGEQAGARPPTTFRSARVARLATRLELPVLLKKGWPRFVPMKSRLEKLSNCSMNCAIYYRVMLLLLPKAA